MKKNQTEDKPVSFRFDKFSLIAVILAVVCLFSYAIVAVKLSIAENGVSVVSFLIIIAILFSVLFLRRNEKIRLNRFIKGLSAACLIAFGMEVFVFNFKSITTDNFEIPMNEISSIYAGNSEAAMISSDKIEMNCGTALYIAVNRDDVNAVRIEFEGGLDSNEDEQFQINADVKDDNFSTSFYRVGEKNVSTHYGKCDFSFDAHEELDTLSLGFSNQKPITITGITLMKALPFNFVDLRFIVVFLILAIIWLIYSFELYKVAYNCKKRKHRAIIFGMAALSAFSIFILTDVNANDTEYVKGEDYAWTNPYLQMFDGFQNGRLHLDIEPSEEFLALENPYDYSLRESQGVFFPWDRAYYDGKFYSYYGVTPVLTYFYPVYLLTGKVPSTNSTCLFFGFFTILFMYGTVLAFVKKYIGKPNFLVLLISLLAAVFSFGIYFNVNSSDMYAVPGATGSCYLMLCLWTGYEACLQQGKKKQPLLFAISGLSFALCLAARPTRALSCLIIAPAFLELLFNRDIKVKSKIISVASFIVPVCIGCGALMTYNYARFDSPFEFGAIYQLTVSDVRANKLSLSLLPNALIYYFTQPIQFMSAFPYVEFQPYHIANNQTYCYAAFSRGALAIPFLAAGFFVSPFLLHHNRRKRGEKLAFNPKTAKNLTYVIILLFSVIIAWLDYCMAGVILSYVCDITPLLTLLSVYVLCDISAQMKQGSEVSVKYVISVSLIAAATIILTILELLSLRYEILASSYPDIWYKGEEIFNFWN